MLNKIKNKKGQVGETVTWFIATIAIVLILMFFTFGAAYLAKTKDLTRFSESAFSKMVFKGDDIYLKKSIYSQSNASAQDAYDIGRYIIERDKINGFDVQANITSKRIMENLKKK